MNFEALKSYMDSLDTAVVPGIDLIVYREHSQIFRHFAGYKDRENGVKLSGNEKYWIFSATKVFTATAAMQCVERGVFALDDPVGKYLPPYMLMSVNDHGHIRSFKQPMTIRQLLTMTAGFNYDLHAPSIEKCKMYSLGKADTLTMLNALAEEPLDFFPGTHFQYSLCHDVLAGVIEAATGLTYSEYLKRNIFEPLGIKNTGFRGENLSEFAVQYVFDGASGKSVVKPEGNICEYRLTENYESGGAGLYSTVNDYILLMDALSCGGVGASGRRILTEDSIRLMSTPQLSDEIRYNDFKVMNHFGPSYTYALGVRVNAGKGSSSPIGEFGWDGAACAYCLSDPVNHLSLYLGMNVRSFGYGYDVIHHNIKDLTYAGFYDR
ncbi:MAG: beta-lactamase family protein [Clostridia bacterium]|nr:beta-lactamase family protein [Clostridia bacterium]